MCQILFDIIKTGNVSIENVKNDITCNFDQRPKPSPPPPPPTPHPNPIPITPVKPPHPNPIPITPVKPPLKDPERVNLKIYILGGIIVVSLLVFLLRYISWN
jgi:predicted Zn-dependent peptidase